MVRKWSGAPGRSVSLLGGGLFHVARAEAVTQWGSWYESSFKKCDLVTEVVDFGLPGIRQMQGKWCKHITLIVGYFRESVICLK